MAINLPMRFFVYIAIFAYFGPYSNLAIAQSSLLVSEKVAPATAKAIQDKFGSTAVYEIGRASKYLLIVKRPAGEKNFGLYSETPVHVAEFILIDSTGRTIAKGNGRDKRSMAAAEGKALKELGLTNLNLADGKTVDWLQHYGKLRVAQGINLALNAEAANFQDLLHYMISRENAAAVSALLPYVEAYGGDISITSNLVYFDDNRLIGAPKGNRFIHTAAFSGNPEVFAVLVAKYPDLTIANDLGLNPAQIAAAALKTKIFLQISEMAPTASRKYATDALFWLLMRTSGFEENLVGSDIRAGIPADIPLTDQSLSTTVKRLIDAGADPKAIWDGKVNPLQLASLSGLLETSKVLLDAGASARLKPEQSALGAPLAIALNGENPELATLLLERGASLNAAGVAHDEAMLRAFDLRSATLLSGLFKAGLSPGIQLDGEAAVLRATRERPELVAELIASGADLSVSSKEGLTALHYAALSGDIGTVERLLAAGANVNLADQSGRTALHLAFPDGSKDLSDRRAELIARLIAAGADPLATNANGLTAKSVYLADRNDYLADQKRRRIAAEERRLREQEEQERRAARERQEADRRRIAAARRRAAEQRNQPDLLGTFMKSFASGLQREIPKFVAQSQRTRQIVRDAQRQYDQAQARSRRQAEEARQAREARYAERRRVLENTSPGPRQTASYVSSKITDAREKIARKPKQSSRNTDRGTVLPKISRPKRVTQSSMSSAVVRSSPSWLENPLSACNAMANNVSLQSNAHNPSRAVAAFKAGCTLTHRLKYSTPSSPSKLQCSARTSYDIDVAELLAEKNLSGYDHYAGQAWSAWRSNLGCR